MSCHTTPRFGGDPFPSPVHSQPNQTHQSNNTNYVAWSAALHHRRVLPLCSGGFYNNMSKKEVCGAHYDMLGVSMLSKNYSEITWDLVANAVPPIKSAGMRASPLLLPHVFVFYIKGE